MKKLVLGSIESLEKRNGVVDVRFLPGSSVSKHEINAWEQKNTCIMPDDLSAFYQTMDGFTLTWSTKLSGDVMPLGLMMVNRMEKLIRLQLTANKEMLSMLDGVFENEDERNANVPHFDSRSRIVELDHCDGHGKVCLVYMGTKPGVPAVDCLVWFMDRSFAWHYLAENFTVYYRLLVAHLGLPQWQYLFTGIGISPQIQQWFNVYAPLRPEMAYDDASRPAAVDYSGGDNKILSGGSSAGTTVRYQCGAQQDNGVDIALVFKGKTEKKKPSISNSAPVVQKKKMALPSATSKYAPSAQRNSSSMANVVFKPRSSP